MSSMDRMNLIDDIKTKSSYHQQAAGWNPDEAGMSEYRLEIDAGCGVTMTGAFEDDADLFAGQIEPYLAPGQVTTMEEVFVEERIDNRSFAGICDDMRIGTTLIFRLLNPVDYLRFSAHETLPVPGTSVCLSALSVDGTIVLPLHKSGYDEEIIRHRADRRRRLLESARDGSEQAMQTITMEDMDTYSDLTGRIQEEDILSLVDSFFMPTGAECDLYYILGDILACRLARNPYTLEVIHILSIRCSGIEFEVAVNEKDLFGYPAPGRRFKGVIWLQGTILFPGISV